MKEITVTELKAKMDAGDNIQLIDVRMQNEFEFAKIEGAKLIPLPDIMRRMDEFDPSKEIVVHCKMGGRSAEAYEMLKQAGFTRIKNLQGGILAWADQVDPALPTY